MKAAEFDYARAASVEEVCRLLDGANGDGKIIAGGQTLVPMLVMRLARPALVIDINPIESLKGITINADAVVIRAGTRQYDALNDIALAQALPLFIKGLAMVGHPQTRNRGTIGGSLANADPAAEISLLARTLDAEITAVSSQGARVIADADFALGAMTTGLSSEECLTEVRFPIWQNAGRIGTAFEEMSIRRSDFALVSAACQVALDRDGVCRRAALGIGGAEPSPLRVDETERRLVGTKLEASDIAAAADLLRAAIDPITDNHASADYRRRVARELAVRVTTSARDEALATRN
jgi:CO/xanthine dehydrogenase FAD-binding subunit